MHETDSLALLLTDQDSEDWQVRTTI